MTLRVWALSGALFVLAAAGASAQAPAGYLAPGAIDAAGVVGPPPAAGSPEAAADLAAYQAAAAAAGTPRWALAREDDSLEMGVVMRRYACALDRDIDPARAPALVRLLNRTVADADAVAKGAKDAYRRPRPFAADDPATPLCVDIPAERRTKTSTSYPSGHGTVGGLWGLVLIQAAPDRAAAIAERSRQFVESRQVCRLHYPSDLRAGERLGGVIFARLQASAEYQADLAAARAEIAAAPKATGCPTP